MGPAVSSQSQAVSVVGPGSLRVQQESGHGQGVGAWAWRRSPGAAGLLVPDQVLQGLGGVPAGVLTLPLAV